MIDFSCPRCGTVYHADESHAGKQIQCTRPGCDELIAIERQDGHFRNSARPLQTGARKQSAAVARGKPLSRTHFRRFKRWSVFAFLCVACVLVAIVWIGLHRGRRRATATDVFSDLAFKPLDADVRQKAAPATLPPDSDQAEQTQQNRELKNNESATSAADPFNYPASPLRLNAPRRPKRHITESQGRSLLSLPTGTRIIPDEATSGDGELKSVNGTPVDAYVIVVDSKTQKRVREISIQARSSFLMEHLDPGDYTVVFATGRDWDGKRFRRNSSYFEFGKTLSFRQNGTSYERHTITLNTVPYGNVPRRRISEVEFQALSGKP